MSNESLTEYIKNWELLDSPKPSNDPTFICDFIEFLDSIDDERDVDFDGDGAYFGKQIKIGYGQGCWSADRYLHFEIAYDSNQIVVYTAKHNGFWSPTFISLTSDHEQFSNLKTSLYKLLQNVFGVPILIS